jgi:hypothetical protein
MLEIDDELWFIEHTILGFDSQIEDRMKVATKKFEEPLMKQAKTRDIRLVVTLTFRSPTVTDTEYEHMLGTLVNHLEKYDKGHVRLNMTYSLFNDSIAIQISNNSHQIASFGNLTIGFTLGLSNKLEEQFEIANRESLTKKFMKQLRRVGEVERGRNHLSRQSCLP